MDNIDKLLEYVRKTNPTMTRSKLIRELNKSRYSGIALVIVLENNKEKQEV